MFVGSGRIYYFCVLFIYFVLGLLKQIRGMKLFRRVSGGHTCLPCRYLLGFGYLLLQIDFVTSSMESGIPSGNHTEATVSIASVNFEEVASPFIITCFVMFAMLSKLAYHHAGFLSSIIPESSVQIILGIIIGSIIHFSGYSDTFPDFFTPHEFFLYLLPPIILEAAYSLNDSIFYDNIGSVLIYAVIGTLLNCFLIGFSLWGLSMAATTGVEAVGLSNFLVFTSVIVAVDPVAVLAIFSEMGVNATLYILVFGESLLNDGVSVVLYSVMQTYSRMDSLPAGQVVLGIVKFIVVAVGGLLIGIIIGMLSALLTKHTFHVRVVEPIMVFGSAFLSYILADMFELSGIISLIGCGLIQAQYALQNVNRKSNIAIKYCIKVASTTSEIIIFLFLGMALVRFKHQWSTGFTLWTILLCLIFRFVVVFVLTYMINTCDRYRVRKIGLDEQFIMGYGGLRGAVCFSLVMMLDELAIPDKRMFVTTTLSVIIFTIIVQGLTIKPLVRFLKVTLQKKDEPNCLIFLTSDVTDHLMAGMEDIIGFHGKYYFKEYLEYYDDRYLKKWLQRKPTKADAEITKVYEKIMLRDHFKHLEMSGAKELPEYAPATPQGTEHEVNIPLQDIGSKDEEEVTPRKRLSRSLSLFKSKSPSELTSEDVRNILNRQATSRNLYHEKYDRDLTRENNTDLQHHLLMKRRMTQSVCLMRERQRSLSAEASQASEFQAPEESTSCKSLPTQEKRLRPTLIKEEHIDMEEVSGSTEDKDSKDQNETEQKV